MPGESTLLRIARPVMETLAAELHDEPVALILTDTNGLVVDRRVGSRALRHELDRADLQPGFTYSETIMGTNGIGTSLETGAATFIRGPEHFAGNLTRFACAGTPVKHPITGQALGILDITSLETTANAMQPMFAKLAAHRIQEAFADAATAGQMALMTAYHSLCRHSGGSAIAIGEGITMINDRAQHQFSPPDQMSLMSQLAGLAGEERERSHVLDLPSGLVARIHHRPVTTGSRLAGATFRVTVDTPAPTRATTPVAASRITSIHGSSATWQRVAATLAGNAQHRNWVEIVGERGVGKRTLATSVAEHVGLGHTWSVDAADTTIEGFLVELETALREARSVHILNIDAFGDEHTADLTELLQLARDGSLGERPWVTVSLHDVDAPQGQLSADMRAFFTRTVEVPPLRQHLEDIPELARAILGTLGMHHLDIADCAHRQLMRLTWPANIAQLRQVLVDVVRTRRSGVIRAEHLPSQCNSTARRTLSKMEVLERDAIVTALTDHDGDKVKAAEALGVSRATIYRKIREYGIIAK